MPAAFKAMDWRRLGSGLALAVVVLCGAVFVRRAVSVAALHTMAPGTAVTSGCEEESFFALWRGVHGEEVYSDTARVPFAAAYFNWLFYAGYRGPVGLAVRMADNPAVIPLAGRVVTAAGALAGFAVLLALLRRIAPDFPAVAAALSAWVFLGPLVGWWSLTVRPDVWALAFEAAALGVILHGRRDHPLAAAAAGALLFFAAWSCKQSYVFGLAGAVLFLAARRQWRPAAMLVGLSVVLWAATLALLGPNYRDAMVESAAGSSWHPAQGWANFRDFLVKGSPLGLLAGGTLLLRGKLLAPGARDAAQLGGWGLLAALPLGFAASCKFGAASNYHFSSLLLLAVCAGGVIAAAGVPRLTVGAVAAMGILQLLVLTGRVGTIDLRGQGRELARIWAVWQPQPEPRFAARRNLNLPWLNPASPPFVLAFNYDSQRRAGRQFENDGVGGMIASGVFASLLLPADTGAGYDGGTLDGYRRGESIGGLTVFHRRASPPP